MHNIKVYKEFLNTDEVDLLIKTIDNNMDSLYSVKQEKLERTYSVGQNNFPAAYNFNSPNGPEAIFPEIQEFVKVYAKRIEEIAKQDSGLDIGLSVLWFVKSQGIHFPAHTDNDGELLYEYNHTCMLYLNDCYGNGQLNFPEYNFTYEPRKGDLVSFPSSYVHEVWKMNEPRYTMPSWFTTNKEYWLFKN